MRIAPYIFFAIAWIVVLARLYSIAFLRDNYRGASGTFVVALSSSGPCFRCFGIGLRGIAREQEEDE